MVVKMPKGANPTVAPLMRHYSSVTVYFEVHRTMILIVALPLVLHPLPCRRSVLIQDRTQ